jgi:hypothetical protein
MAEPAAHLFSLELPRFVPGAKLEIAEGSFRGIGFGGRATVTKFDADHLELDLRVTKLVFHIDVKLQFRRDAQGKAQFFGGRPDGKRTGSEPAHVKHTMTVTEQTPERTVFEFSIDDSNSSQSMRTVVVERRQVKGAEAMRITYDRYAMTLAPAR